MRLAAWIAAILLASAGSALAQQPQRLPLFAADLRGFSVGLKQDPITAGDMGVLPEVLPSRGLGGVAGVHLYPLRGSRMALGVGVEMMIARGRKQDKDAVTGAPIDLPIEQRLRSLSPQVSLNFGSRDGWSYVSAGMGQLSFETFRGETAPAMEPPTKSTINMGGGARWFAQAHLAFCFDVRFYLTRPESTIGPFPARQRSRLLVMSAGIAFK
jgi:hypothetical protein